MIGYRRTVSMRRALSLRFSHIRDSSTCPLSRLSTGHRPSHLPPSYRTQSRMRPNAFGSALMLSHVERAYAYAKATPTECPSIQVNRAVLDDLVSCLSRNFKAACGAVQYSFVPALAAFFDNCRERFECSCPAHLIWSSLRSPAIFS